MGDLMELMRAEGLGRVPVIVGGIIPEEDAVRLRAMGVAQVYTPKDFRLNQIMMDIVALVDQTSGCSRVTPCPPPPCPSGRGNHAPQHSGGPHETGQLQHQWHQRRAARR